MRLKGLTCAAVALLVAGCGSAQSDSRASGDRLTVYSALPLKAPESDRARDILAGEKLALAEAGRRAGRFRIAFRSLDDSTVEARRWDPGKTLAAARRAAADPSAIAYLGDLDAGATALSLPTTNAVGVLQVTPGATYAGFTGEHGGTEGEPEKYYPSGRRTFGRIPPPDTAQAEAQVRVLMDGGCRRVAVLSAPSAFDHSLAQLVAQAATAQGIVVVLEEAVRPDPDAQRALARRVAQAGAGCATFAGELVDGPAALFDTLHAAVPDALLVAPMALSDGAFARALGPAAAVTRIVGPPRPSRRFRAAFAHAYGEPPGPWAPYGYEAMRSALAAISHAGADGNDRRAVIASYLATPPRTRGLAVWRVQGGTLVHPRRL